MVAEKHRRLLRARRAKLLETRAVQAAAADERPRSWLGRVYRDRYTALFAITIALLIFSLIAIGVTYARTGDVIHKGVSLSGGMTITVATSGTPLDTEEVAEQLRTAAPDADIVVRETSDLGRQVGLTVEASTGQNTPEELSRLETAILDQISRSVPDVRGRTSTEMVGPSLGASFFRQTAKAVLVAFTMMGLVVFLYFGDRTTHKVFVAALTIVAAWLIWNAHGVILASLAVVVGAALVWCYVRWSIPSAAVILAAASTILFTIAVVDLMGMRISTAGIAAFLMLIGYSVDTDILLSNRVLKRDEGTVYARVVSTVKTGLTMTGTTLAASLVALVFTQSAVIREIMTIICIGLVADILYTWIQNAGILRLWLAKRRGA